MRWKYSYNLHNLFQHKNTIRCDYSEVAELTSTLGNIEVTRHDTYQQFKCSKSKGTYDINGGHV